MSYYRFDQNDIFTNRIKAHPRSYFLINNNKIYYNNDVIPSGPTDGTILDGSQFGAQGEISLYEMNINRDPADGLIYPYVTKEGTLGSFKSVSTESFQSFDYGTEISGSYPLKSTISIDYYSISVSFPPDPVVRRDRIYSLKNSFNYYRTLSNHYTFETSEWNKATQDIKLVSIPSIFYGSSIKKGSVKLNFYITGSLIATLEDTARNGELIQTYEAPYIISPASAAGGNIAFASEILADYNNKKIILEDTSGTSETFIFDSTGTEGATGTIDASGFIIVQINNLLTKENIMLEFSSAVDSSSIQISTNPVVPFAAVGLQQELSGDSGNTVMQNPDSIPGLTITQFIGGADSSSSTGLENQGKVAGVILYNEGFVALTGSWDLNSHQEEYISGQGQESPKWKHWGEKDRISPPTDFAISSSWDINFLGTNYIPTMTMLAHAKQGDLNYSNNPTFIDYEDRNDNMEAPLSPNKFLEDKEMHIANITQSPYPNTSGSFEKTTYISKIGIYDENKNLIGIAKLATPVRKTESRQYTFKMKLDF